MTSRSINKGEFSFSSVFITLLLILLFSNVYSQSIIINELSQGDTGGKEYVEFLVTGPPACDPSEVVCLDLTHWIFDDNNGYFSGGPMTGAGIASGAVRFADDPFWSCIPAGTRIVIYNDADRNDDILGDDLDMNDGNCTIVIPISSTLFERATISPTPSDDTYSTNPGDWSAGGSWNQISMANTDDSFQIYDPNDTSTPVFGVSWGGDNNVNNIIYMGSTSAAGDVFSFTNTNSDDATDQSNWVVEDAATDQSVGTSNTNNNSDWSTAMNPECRVPLDLLVTATATTCNECNGTASATGSGDLSPYTYEWSNGSNNANISNLCDGTYTVTLTDALGCTLVESVTVTPSTGVSADLLPTLNQCFDGNSFTFDGSGSTLAAGLVASPTYSWDFGDGTGTSGTGVGSSSSETHTYTSPGTYIVNLSLTEGICTDVATITVVVNDHPNVTLTPSPLNCGIPNTGSVSSTTTGGSPAYGYLWSTSSNQDNITSLNTGTYFVTVTDANGCSAIAQTTVTAPSSISVTPTFTSVTCPNANDGSVNATAAGGGAYNYVWSTLGAGQAHTNVAPNVYTVTATDAVTGCSDVASVTISEPTNITITVNVTPSLCFGTTGTTDATAVGGASGFTYVWSSGVSTQTAANLLAGNYDVTVTDQSGCSAIESAVITEPAAITLTTNQTPADCNGENNGTATAVAGGNGPFQYSWSTTETTANINGPSANYTVTVTDQNGCTESSTISITQPTTVTNAIVGVSVTCNAGSDGQATATTVGGTTPYTYLWDGAANFQTTNNATSLSANIYQVTVTDFNGCMTIESINILEPAAITVTVNPSPATCGNPDGSATTTVTGGSPAYTFLWNTAATTNQITGIVAGVYTATVTDQNGCTSSNSGNINDAGGPAVTITNVTHLLCIGVNTGQATAVPSGGTTPYDFAWSNGHSTTTTTGLAAGVVTVTITDNNGCLATTFTNISSPTSITTNTLDGATSCASGADGTVSVSATGGTTDYTYLWSQGATTNSATGLIAGNYIVTITDANGCSVTDDAAVTQPTNLTVTTVIVDASCNGLTGSVDLTATGGTSGYLFDWSNGTNTEDQPALLTNNYSVTVTDQNGCSTIGTAQITEPTIVDVNISCTSASTPIAADGASNSASSGGTTPYSYLWSNGATTSNISNLAPAIYAITLTDANGCSATDQCEVISDPCVATISTSITPVLCTGGSEGSATGWLDGTAGPYTFLWDNGQSTATATGLTAGTYNVSIQNNLGCDLSATVVLVSVSPISTTITFPTIACFGDQTLLNLSVDGGTPGYSYVWSSGPTAQDISVGAGTYQVTVTDFNQCTSMASTTVSQPSAVSVTAVLTHPTCAGLNNGNIDVTASGGTTTYGYLWNDFSVTEDFTNALAGNFQVTVTDLLGCSTTLTASLVDPAAISVTLSPTDANCGTANGAITSTVAGGGSTYSYSWSNGATTNAISGLSAAAYQLTVTDNNNCSNNATAAISNLGGATVTVTTITQVSCISVCDGSLGTQVSGGSTPYTYQWSTNQTNSAAINLCAGNHTVTVTDQAGCIAIDAGIITEPTALATNSTKTDASCNGYNDGTGAVSVIGGTSAYQYLWSNGATTNNITGSAAGYYVTITDANGCEKIDSARIAQPFAITITTTSTNSNCNQADGAVSASAIGGNGTPFTYVWSSATTGATAASLFANTYTVTVTDANGCTNSGDQIVSDQGGGSVTISVTDNVSCFGTCDGQATTFVTGGATPFTYLWSNGHTTSSSTGLCAGNTQVTVTDNVNCVAIASDAVLTPQALSITANVSCTSAFGAADGVIFATVSGGTTNYSYAWSNGSTLNSTTGVSANYQVTVTDANGCSINTADFICSPATILVNAVPTQPLCNGDVGSLAATSSGGITPHTYEWFNGATSVSVNQTTTAVPGSYFVVVTDQNGITAASATVTLTAPPSLTVTIASQTNVSCNGLCDGQVQVSVDGGTSPFNYNWDNGETTPLISNLCAGPYLSSVTDNNGCLFVSTISVTSPPALSLTVSPNNLSCFSSQDGSVSSTANGGVAPYQYLWNTLETTQSLTGLSAANYSVTVVDANGCSVVADQAITQPSATLLSSDSTQSTCNQSDGSATVLIDAGDPPFTYAWPNGQTTNTATGLAADLYSVTVTNGVGCETVRIIGVTDAGAPTVVIMNVSPITCQSYDDGFAQVNVFGGTTPVTYQWYNPGGSPDQTTAFATGLSPGSWTAQMTDATGCEASINVSISEPTAVSGVISSQTDVTCFGQQDGAATVIANGGTPNYTYVWNNGQTTSTATGLAAGAYQVNIADDNNCPALINVTITEPLPFNVSATATSAYCNTATGDACVLLTNGVGPYTYTWSNGQVDSCAALLASANYSVTVTDNRGCIKSTTFFVADIPAGTAVITSNDANCFNQRDGEATVSMLGTGTPPYQYIWSDNQITATATGLTAGTYIVSVVDANNCLSNASVTISQPSQLLVTVTGTQVSCSGVCDGTATAFANGGTTPYTYVWNDPQGQTSPLATGICEGTAVVSVTDANGCETNGSATIDTPNPIILNTTNIPANCGQPDGSGCVSATGGSPGYTYSWSNGITASCLIGIPAGVYGVTVTDDVGCSQTTNMNVDDLNGPSAEIADSTLVSCYGQCNGQAEVNMIGGTASSYTVSWIDQLNVTISTTPIATNLCAGTYTAELTDNLGCKAYSSVIITEPSELIASTTNTPPSCFSYCDGTASINITGGTTPYAFTWSAGNVSSVATSSTSTGLCDGNYNVNVIDGQGCALTESYTITSPVEVSGNLSTNDANCYEVCDGDAIVVPTAGVVPITYQWSTGQATSFVNGLCDGPISVTLTDQNGCSTIRSSIINQPTELNASIDGFGNVSCYGQNDGYIAVSANGGTPGAGYQYQWSGLGSQPSQITNLYANNYNVTVSDANGCQLILNQPITHPPLLEGNVIQFTDPTCANSCDASATVSGAGGTTPYFYQWNAAGNFHSGPTTAGICADAATLVVTVTDAKGCSMITDHDVTPPSDFVINITTDSSHCELNDGAIQVQVGGATADYLFDWFSPTNPTQTFISSGFIDNIPAGLYELTIIDAVGCTMDTLVGISDILGPEANGNATPLTCFDSNDGSANFFVSAGTPPYDLNWIYQGDTILTDVVSGVGLEAGAYTFLVEDAVGCKDVEIVQVNAPPAVIGYAYTAAEVSCFGGSDGITSGQAAGGNGSGIASNYSFVWSDGQTTTIATGLQAGIYGLVVSDQLGCSIVVTTTVTQPTPMQITLTTSDALCFGDAGGVIASNMEGGTPPYVIIWSPVQPPNPTIYDLTAGDYDVTITDVFNCTVTHTTTVNEPALLATNLSNTPTSCEACNGTATATTTSGGTPPYNYLWSNGDVTSSSTDLCATNYGLTVTDDHGCVAIATTSITNLASPTVDITFTEPTCNGLSSGSATAVTTLGAAMITNWQWSNNQNSATSVNLATGAYSVTVTDLNGCTAASAVFVTEPTPFQLMVTSLETMLCAGQSTQVFATPTGGTLPYGNYNWNSAAAVYADQSTAFFTATPPPGTTTFYGLSMFDGNGCYDADSLSITVSPELNLFVPGLLSLCIEQSEAICVSATGGASIDYTFTWSTGEIDQVPGQANACTNITPTENTTVTVVLSDGCSTPIVGEIPIIVNPLPVIAVNADLNASCPPFDPGFDVSFGDTDTWAHIEFDVDFDGVVDYDTIVENDTDVEFPHLYQSAGVYSVWAQVTSDSGCVQHVILDQYITVFPEPIADFTADPINLSLIDPIVNVNGLLTIGASPDSMIWEFGDGQSANGYTAQNNYMDTGSYTIDLIAINEYGCFDTASVDVAVAPAFSMYTPNAFTPNGDGLNDTFFPKGVGINPDRFTFLIFDRWGEIIFQSTHLDDQWDGTARAKGGGEVVQTGVYVWYIETEQIGSSEKTISARGHVTLLK